MGDVQEEIRDPLRAVSSSYETVYGFIPRQYKRHDFLQTVTRSLKTQDIEKIVKNGKVYLRLTSQGKEKVQRDFPLLQLTKKWNKKWIVLIFDIEESSRKQRDKLRNKLKELGCGMLQKSVWITPLSIGIELEEYMKSLGMSEHVIIMEVTHISLEDPKELVRKVWKLDALEKTYERIQQQLKEVHTDIAISHDREEFRKDKQENSQLLLHKKMLMNEWLGFAVSFPPLPISLLPSSFKGIFRVFT